MSRPTLDTILAKASADTRRLNSPRRGIAVPANPATGGAGDCRHGQTPKPAETANPGEVYSNVQKNVQKTRDRTPKPATKAEAEWMQKLQRISHCDVVLSHPFALIDPSTGDRYTPDAAVFSPGRSVLYSSYEVKAGYRGPGWEQGTERFKRFRELYPWANLRLAEKRRDGAWYVDGEKWEG